MTALQPEFWARPFAHRGLHDMARGRAENSIAAFDAAIAGNYAIELDVQASADGEAMVFHDYELTRLTGQEGRVVSRNADDLRAVTLIGGGAIPDLETVLRHIDGRVPVLIEIKDQTGAYARTDGALERRVCEIVKAVGHGRACAIMSFNPFSVNAVKIHAPEVARGIVAYDFEHPHDAHIDAEHRKMLAELAMFDACEAQFVSYDAAGLDLPTVVAKRRRGVPVFSWTIRSAAEAEAALDFCDQITFERFLP